MIARDSGLLPGITLTKEEAQPGGRARRGRRRGGRMKGRRRHFPRASLRRLDAAGEPTPQKPGMCGVASRVPATPAAAFINPLSSVDAESLLFREDSFVADSRRGPKSVASQDYASIRSRVQFYLGLANTLSALMTLLFIWTLYST